MPYHHRMRRDEVFARLKSAEPALRASGVAALYLFGSHARDEARDDSDIDVFVDPAPGVTFGFLPFMAACEAIEAAVGGRVDYGTRSGLHPILRPQIERDAVRVF
ncbi:nucleotidyltransferase family protein [Methylobacterium tarhaniae]|nr:nucleotidyltransferase domain-containing protein [Methylobacterium tarhaniae]